MPAEVRFIVFSSEEILLAVENYADRSFGGLSRGSVVDLEVFDEEEPRIRALLKDQPTGLIQLDIEPAEVLALMIRACKRSRVPLPAHVLKRPCVINGRLAITVLIDRRTSRSVHEAASQSQPPLRIRAGAAR